MAGGTEFFYTNEDGTKGDDWIHEEILADGDEVSARKISRKIARRVGLTATQIDLLLPRDVSKAYVTRDQDDYLQDPKTGLMQGRKPGGGGAAAPAEKPAADKPERKGKGQKVSSLQDFDKPSAKLRMTSGILPDGEKAKTFMSRWNAVIDQSPEEFKQQFLGGLNATMVIDYDTREDKMEVRGNLLDKNGNNIGEYTRYLDLDDKYGKSSYFKMTSSERGHDVGKQLLAANVEMYQQLGMKRVEVYANIDVGGYAWARYGYVPKQSSWRALQGTLESRIRTIERGLTGGGGAPARPERRTSTDTYTPDSWDEIGEDDRERIYEAWKNATADEFFESEQQSWWDNGGGLEDAKISISQDFSPDEDWAKIAMNEWRDEE